MELWGAPPMSTNPISDHAVLRFLERAYGLGPLIASARSEMAAGASRGQPDPNVTAPIAKTARNLAA